MRHLLSNKSLVKLQARTNHISRVPDKLCKLTLSKDSTKSLQIRHRFFWSLAPRELAGDRIKTQRNKDNITHHLSFVNMVGFMLLSSVVRKLKLPGNANQSDLPTLNLAPKADQSESSTQTVAHVSLE